MRDQNLHRVDYCPLEVLASSRWLCRGLGGQRFPSRDGRAVLLSALAIVIDPGRAPAVLLVGLASAGSALARRPGAGASGAAIRPALVWVALALALSVGAQLVALTEPLSSGRAMAGRLTYLSVLAILAALVSVLNARTPGERVWAGLMFLLVVVFMIPWLEEAGRIWRPQGVVLVHLDAPGRSFTAYWPLWA